MSLHATMHAQASEGAGDIISCCRRRVTNQAARQEDLHRVGERFDSMR